VVLLERDNISKNAPNELVFHFNPPRNMGRGETKKEFMFFFCDLIGEANTKSKKSVHKEDY